MVSIEQSALEFETLAAFAESESERAANAIGLLQAWPAFTDEACQRIFDRISTLVFSKDCGTTVEVPTLLSHLRTTGGGNRDAQLFDEARKRLASSPWLIGRPEEAAKILVDSSRRRRAARIMADAAGRIATTEDIDAELLAATDRLSRLALRSRKQKTKQDLVVATMHEIEQVRSGAQAEGVHLGVAPPADKPSRLRNLLLLRPSKLYALGALKKTGKSKFLIHVLHAASRAGVPCEFMSLEMTDRKVLEWWVSREAAIDSKRIPSREITDDEIRRIGDAMDAFLLRPMEISYHPGATVAMVQHEARRLRLRHPDAQQAIIGIDHIGLMTHDRTFGSEAAAFEDTCKGLLRVAQEYEVSIIVLSQCPVSAEHKDEPWISDLKWSGAIAECSEAIMMLHNAGRQRRQGGEADAERTEVSMRIWQRDGQSNVRVPMIADLTTGRFFEV